MRANEELQPRRWSKCDRAIFKELELTGDDRGDLQRNVEEVVGFSCCYGKFDSTRFTRVRFGTGVEITSGRT